MCISFLHLCKYVRMHVWDSVVFKIFSVTDLIEWRRTVCVQPQGLQSFWRSSVIVLVENVKFGIASAPVRTNQRQEDKYVITFWNYSYCTVYWVFKLFSVIPHYTLLYYVPCYLYNYIWSIRSPYLRKIHVSLTTTEWSKHAGTVA